MKNNGCMKRDIGKILLAGGMDSVPSHGEMMRYMDDAEFKKMRLGELSFIDTWDDIDVLSGFDSRARTFLELNHNKELNTCQPNMAPLSFGHLKSWAPEFLRNGMVQPIYVVRIKKKKVNYVIGGRHTCALLALVYSFDFDVPVFVMNVGTMTEAKMLSVALNKSRTTTRVETACTELPHLMMRVDILKDGGVMRFASIVLGKNHNEDNKHKEWQEKFLIALLTAPKYLGNLEIGVTPDYVMEELGLEYPKWNKPLRKDGTKGAGFTEKEMVGFVKNSTSLKSLKGDVDDCWEVYRTQLMNSFDVYNSYCSQIDIIKENMKMCLEDKDTSTAVKNK